VRRDRERLYVFALVAISAALLGALVGLAAALLLSREAPLPPNPPHPEPPAVVASDPSLDRMIAALEHPSPPPGPPFTQVALPPPRVIGVVYDDAGVARSCVVQGRDGEQHDLAPGDRLGDDILLRIVPRGEGARAVFSSARGEWWLDFDPRE
jgi:hypothetical protein